ncbi:MAG: MBL fold metallo-hydrolase [Thiotrichaceae bacterium]
MTHPTQPSFPHISHHGAVHGVTGSCHELHLDKSNSVLIDCGIFQGSDKSPYGKADAWNLELDFDISSVQALIITHCHIDHAGRIPWLLAAGFDGTIYCSQPTAKLLPLMLEDAAKIGITRDKKIIKKLVDKIKSMMKPIKYQEWAVINDSLQIRLQRAGHILGSAYVECEINKNSDKRIVFSGDLGAPHAPLLPAPKPPKQCHTLVIESTYGHKLHDERKNRKERLRAIIQRCFDNRGAVLIPSFSLGRTQELMYEFEQIIYENESEWGEIEVIIDSPLASRFTAVYRELKPFWDDEAQGVIEQGRYPLTFKQLHTIESHQDHKSTVKYLKKTARPTIVIAASGMCNGGRIMGYLKALLGDERTDILFSGYQAKNSIGRQIFKYGPKNGWVEIDNERYEIKAKIHQIGGYSAHADQQNLLDFATQMEKGPEEVRVLHGDENAKEVLKVKLEELLPDATVVIPKS